jgi:hypothetical protein
VGLSQLNINTKNSSLYHKTTDRPFRPTGRVYGPTGVGRPRCARLPEFADQGKELGFIGTAQRAFEVVGAEDFALAAHSADLMQVGQPGVVYPDYLVVQEQFFVVFQIFRAGDFAFPREVKMGAVAFALAEDDLSQPDDRQSVVAADYQIVKALWRGG